MKNFVLYFLLLGILSAFSYKDICFKNKNFVNKKNLCLKESKLDKLITENKYEIIFCKIDSLENRLFVKNCLLKLNDSSKLFLSSNIHKKDDKISLTYVEINVKKSPYTFYLDVDKTAKKKVIKKMDNILVKTKLASNYN